MSLNYHLVTGPTAEPVTLALTKSHLRLEAAFADDDALIQSYITAARQLCEKEMARAIFNQTWMLTLDHFPWYNYRDGTFRQTNRDDWAFVGDLWQGSVIKLPMPRAVSITSITYVDLSGVTQTIDKGLYYADVNSEPARVVPLPGSYWPYSQQYLPGSVQVTFVTGTYGDGTDLTKCPQTIVLAILQLVAGWYENRESITDLTLKEMPFGVSDKLQSEKFYAFTLENN